MDSLLFMTITVIVMAVIFDFTNGFNDAANIVATMISSRSISPEAAITIAAVCEFIGPLVLGTAVAQAIGKGIVDPGIMTPFIISCALAAAILWNILAWFIGIPSSSSHALVGGIAGSVIVGVGMAHLKWAGFIGIVTALIAAPFLGALVGFSFHKISLFMVRGCTPGVNAVFKRSQIFSSIALALSHGGNDAQKSMGIITMVLVSYHHSPEFHVPLWVIVTCAAAISLGTASGGWRIIKTLGSGIYKLRPIHSFSAQSASASVILTAALLGGPVSTTHVATSSIMGVGSAERVKAVRWLKMREIVMTWVLTIPGSALLAAVIFSAMSLAGRFWNA